MQTIGALSPAAKAGGHRAGQLKASKLAVDQAAQKTVFGARQVFVQMLLMDVACNEDRVRQQHGIKPNANRGEAGDIKDWTGLLKVSKCRGGD